MRNFMRNWLVAAAVALLYALLVALAIVLLGPQQQPSYSPSSSYTVGVPGPRTGSGGSEGFFLSRATNGMAAAVPEPEGPLIPAVVREVGRMEIGQDHSVVLADGTTLKIAQTVPVLIWTNSAGSREGIGYWANYPVRMQEGQKVFLVTEQTPKGELRTKEIRIREEE